MERRCRNKNEWNQRTQNRRPVKEHNMERRKHWKWIYSSKNARLLKKIFKAKFLFLPISNFF